MGKDRAEDVVGGDFAGDLAQVVECLAYVLAHEVAADAQAQRVDGALEGFSCTYQCLVVAGIGHDYGILAYGWQGCSLEDELLQALDVALTQSRDGDGVCSLGELQ